MLHPTHVYQAGGVLVGYETPDPLSTRSCPGTERHAGAHSGDLGSLCPL